MSEREGDRLGTGRYCVIDEEPKDSTYTLTNGAVSDVAVTPTGSATLYVNGKAL